MRCSCSPVKSFGFRLSCKSFSSRHWKNSKKKRLNANQQTVGFDQCDKQTNLCVQIAREIVLRFKRGFRHYSDNCWVHSFDFLCLSLLFFYYLRFISSTVILSFQQRNKKQQNTNTAAIIPAYLTTVDDYNSDCMRIDQRLSFNVLISTALKFVSARVYVCLNPQITFLSKNNCMEHCEAHLMVHSRIFHHWEIVNTKTHIGNGSTVCTVLVAI